MTTQTIKPAPGHSTARITYDRPLPDPHAARYVGRHRRQYWFHRSAFLTAVLTPIVRGF